MASKINKNKVIAAAQKYVQKGQYDKAIREYSKIVEEDPRDVRIWLKIGDLHAKKNNQNEAVETYSKVAEFYSEQGFYLKSVAVYKQILKIDNSLVEINLRLAELYKQLGLLSDAMQQYEQVSNHYHQVRLLFLPTLQSTGTIVCQQYIEALSTECKRYHIG